QISMEDAKLLPALFGEVDIIKTLQLKPGVSSGGEGTSGLSVRGGTGDQNLFLLDEATVYNPQHLFGFFSTFNSDAVKNVDLYKGGFPAQYGGRLSSVVDVKLRDGNRKKFEGAGGLGLIASRLTLEGPIVKDKGSFIISGRRTYVDIFTSAINKRNEGNEDANLIPAYFFYDLNGKINYDLGEKDKVFVSGYFGKDKFGFSDDDFNFDFNWGNIALTTRWNHVYNSKLFSNTTLTFSDYNYNIKNRLGDFATFELGSGIRDYTGKIDYFYSPDNKHNIKFGASTTYHEFEVGRLSFNDDDNTFNFQAGQDFDAWAFGGYISDDFEVNEDLKINYGLRVSAFYNDKFY
ncbi:MAG: TonB-dependent receptor plug domain-containing protein, partial [Saprospiraceae bacterium]